MLLCYLWAITGEGSCTTTFRGPEHLHRERNQRAIATSGGIINTDREFPKKLAIRRPIVSRMTLVMGMTAYDPIEITALRKHARGSEAARTP